MVVLLKVESVHIGISKAGTGLNGFHKKGFEN